VYESWHEKWLNDRHLAERLRDLVHTSLLADRAARSGAAIRAANLLPFYQPTNEWFTSTLARLEGRTARAVPRSFDPATHVVGLAALVRDGWIVQQAEHHETVRAREEHAEHFARRFTLWTIVAVVAVAALHALGIGHSDEPHPPSLARVDLWIGFLAVVLPAWGAAYHAVEALDDHPRIAERSGRMASLLRGVAQRLGAAPDLASVNELVAEARRIIELEGQDFAESLRARAPQYHG